MDHEDLRTEKLTTVAYQPHPRHCSQPFLNMVFACCMDVHMVTVHTWSTSGEPKHRSSEQLSHNHCLLSKWRRHTCAHSHPCNMTKTMQEKILPDITCGRWHHAIWCLKNDGTSTVYKQSVPQLVSNFFHNLVFVEALSVLLFHSSIRLFYMCYEYMSYPLLIM